MSKNRKRTRLTWRSVAVLALMAAGAGAPAAAGGLYKWTDDQGMVHYSDQMPPDAMNKGSVVFDKQGRTLKKIDPAPTAAQLKAKEAEDERARAIAKTQEEKLRRDTALLHSYTSEEEIDFARNRALSAIESQLKSADEYAAELARRQKDLQAQKLAFAGKPVPAALDNELAAVDEELTRQAKVLAQRKADRAAIVAKYDNDKQRFREIKAEQAVAPSSAAAASGKGTATSSK